jgi:hypothetical protein
MKKLMDQFKQVFASPIPPEPASDREDIQRDLYEMPEKASPQIIAALESKLAALEGKE